MILLVFGQQADDEVTITADAQERDGTIASATGNVVVLYQDVRVEASWVRYDESTRILEAGDSVHF